MSALEVPEEAIEAAATAARKHFEMPYMARTRNFTDEQIAAGELRAADLEADRMNREAVAAVVEAAAPLIVAAELDAQARQLRLTAGAVGKAAMGTPASGMVVVLNDLAEDMETRASVLRGEGEQK